MEVNGLGEGDDFKVIVWLFIARSDNNMEIACLVGQQPRLVKVDRVGLFVVECRIAEEPKVNLDLHGLFVDVDRCAQWIVQVFSSFFDG